MADWIDVKDGFQFLENWWKVVQSAELKESKGRSRFVGIHFISQFFVKWLALHVLSQGSGPMTHLHRHVFEPLLMRASAWGDRDGRGMSW